MNRYKFIIDRKQTATQIIGYFPWGSLINPKETNIPKEKLGIFEDGVEFLKQLAAKNISVVMFMNQLKSHPWGMNDYQKFITGLEEMVRSYSVNLIGIYWCPGVDKRDPFVVPNPGMFNRATENTGINWTNIPVLSASDLDLDAAAKVKAQPLKLGEKSLKHTNVGSVLDWINSQ